MHASREASDSELAREPYVFNCCLLSSVDYGRAHDDRPTYAVQDRHDSRLR
jgi:hypothetical protein